MSDSANKNALIVDDEQNTRLEQELCAPQEALRISEEKHRQACDELEVRVQERTAELAQANQELQAEIAERRRAEEALRDSEKRYRSLFERVPVGLYRTTAEGRILDANLAQALMLGYPDLESLLKTNTEDVYVNPQDRQRWKTLMDRDGALHDFEVQLRRHDGKLIWVRDRSRAIHDADGRVLCYEGSLEDITERKQAELALDERIKELGCLYAVHRDLQEASSLDRLCWRIVTHLESAMQFPQTAVPVVELYGAQFASDRYVRELPHHLCATIQVSGEVCGRLLVYYPDAASFLIPEEHDLLNTIAEALGLWLERKQAEEALRKSERKLRAQYQSIPIPTYTWQRIQDDIVLVDYNDAAMVATQGKIADSAGVTAREMYHDTPEVLEELTWCFTERSSLEREMLYPLKTAEGSDYLAVKYAFVPPDQVSVYTEDITKRKRMEQYLLRSERLAAMGYMAATLAHEIKNPLQAIQSHLELVADFDLQPNEREEYLRFCSQEIERLTGITERVLSFARPAPDTFHPTSIAHLMQRALAISKPLQHARVHVSTDIPADLPPVLVIPDQIIQVLLNLMINAIEAIQDTGHVHVTARVDQERKDKDMVVLTLTNDGPPIPPEHIEHIFDPFFTTKPGGVGLGLFASHHIVEQHGGMISVENLPDEQGVAFGIALPIARPAEEQELAA
jgi:PAS domain S-box-containing protein